VLLESRITLYFTLLYFTLLHRLATTHPGQSGASLLVLQVHLSCILRGFEGAEVVLVAGRCGALSIVPAMVRSHPLVT
jgi:hypothetical protein